MDLGDIEWPDNVNFPLLKFDTDVSGGPVFIDSGERTRYRRVSSVLDAKLANDGKLSLDIVDSPELRRRVKGIMVHRNLLGGEIDFKGASYIETLVQFYGIGRRWVRGCLKNKK